MPETTKKRGAPLSIRLSRDERARLERDATGMSLGAYIKWRLFDPNNPPPRTRMRVPRSDQVLLSQVLARLGTSRLSANLNQLAKAANSGSLTLDPDTLELLREACRAVIVMRAMLMRALGMAGDAP